MGTSQDEAPEGDLATLAFTEGQAKVDASSAISQLSQPTP